MDRFPKNLLVIMDKPVLGGAEKALLGLLKKHVAGGGQVYIVTERGGELAGDFENLAQDILYVKFPYVSKIVSWVHYFKFLKQAQKFLRRLPRGTVALVNDVYPLWAVTQLKRWCCKDLEVWSIFQGEYVFEDDRCARKWIRYGGEYADRLLASSPVCDHINRCGLMPRVVEVHNPYVDVDRYTNVQADGLKAQLGLSEDKKVAIVVGRVSHQKGQRWLVEQFLKNEKLQENWQLLVVGPFVEDELFVHDRRFWKMVEFEEKDKVLVLGAREDVHKLLKVSDLSLFPGYFYESYGLAFVEAILMELPIIGIEQGAYRYWLGEDYPGLVDRKDPDMLIKIWEDLDVEGLWGLTSVIDFERVRAEVAKP